VESTSWMTDERWCASANGVPSLGRVGETVAPVALQIPKRAGFVPPAYGPGLVCGTSTFASHINDHVEMGRTAWDGTPLGFLGAATG